MLNILQVWTVNFQMLKLVLEKAEEPDTWKESRKPMVGHTASLFTLLNFPVVFISICHDTYLAHFVYFLFSTV